MKITPKFFSLLTLTLTFILSTGLSAKSMKEIDAAIESSLTRFTTEIQGGDTYLEIIHGSIIKEKNDQVFGSYTHLETHGCGERFVILNFYPIDN